MTEEHKYQLINQDEEKNVPYQIYTINFKLGDYEMIFEWKAKERKLKI